MSWRSLIRTDRAGPVTEIGWYGKIPAAGDFVTKRLPRELAVAWDQWMQAGMLEVRDAAPDDWSERYRLSPLWNALVPAGPFPSFACLAVIAPSVDRVGRAFPLCIILPMPPQALSQESLRRKKPLFGAMADAAYRAVNDHLPPDRIDDLLARIPAGVADASDDAADGASDIAEVLGPAASDLTTTMPFDAGMVLPWPDLEQLFEPRGQVSYWWTSRLGGKPLRGLTFSGRPDAWLFKTLFGGDFGRHSDDRA
jgi:type VI secretion system protein ImpM